MVVVAGTDIVEVGNPGVSVGTIRPSTTVARDRAKGRVNVSCALREQQRPVLLRDGRPQ